MNRDVVCVNGARHDLWWEFSLAASFRWQAHIHQLRQGEWQRRMTYLAGALELLPLLNRRVEDLTASERAKADLAVALLPPTHVLVWEEPFRLLDGQDRTLAVDLVRGLRMTEGLTVVTVSDEPFNVEEETGHEPAHETGPRHAGDGDSAWSARRWAAASGTDRA